MLKAFLASAADAEHETSRALLLAAEVPDQPNPMLYPQPLPEKLPPEPPEQPLVLLPPELWYRIKAFCALWLRKLWP